MEVLIKQISRKIDKKRSLRKFRDVSKLLAKSSTTLPPHVGTEYVNADARA